MPAAALVSALLMLWCGLSVATPAVRHTSSRDTLPDTTLDLRFDDGLIKRQRRSLMGKYYGKSSERFLRMAMAPPAVSTVPSFGSAFIECEFVGSPPPSIDWLKDNRLIRQAGLFEALEEQTNSLDSYVLAPSNTVAATRARLYLDCVTPRDQGLFTCHGQTGFQTESVASQLLVQEEANSDAMAVCERVKDMSIEPARVVQWRTRMLTQIGETARLVCETTGYPTPAVTWYHNEHPVTEANPRIRVTLEGDLILDPLKWSDMGLYTCTATNEFGSDEVTTFLYPFKG